MPRFDGTGPMGQGPMTGRGMGPCNTSMGRGFGRGRGMRMFCPAMQPMTKEEEKKMLEAEIRYMEEYIKELKKRLE
jgi:hypothetical protein